MAKLYCLFSSSKGNCYYFSHGNGAILIDAGRSCKQICNALCEKNLSLDSIKAIFITHEHSDHTGALATLQKKIQAPIYATRGTINELLRVEILKDGSNYKVIDDEGIDIDGLKIKSFRTSHDCSESCGYTVTTPENFKLSICTDLGYVSPAVSDAVSGSDAVVIEFNHDVNMLKTGIYPPPLKKRILGTCGHLSNESAAEFCSRLSQNGTTKFFLAHISQENNTPLLAETALNVSLKKLGLQKDIDYTVQTLKPQDNEIAYL